jgi:excisionase family DNA binding protein
MSDGLALAIPDAVLDAFAVRVAELVLERLPASATEEPWHLLDVEEAARRLGRSTRWVRERVKAGELEWVRLDGGAFAFTLAQLQAFASERRIACGPRARAEEPLHTGDFSRARRSASQKVPAA